MSPTPGADALGTRPVEVDAARLLLILYRFAHEPTTLDRGLRCWPAHDVSRVLSPEYLLQKLDFLVRYPAYLAYELVEMHSHGMLAAADGAAVKGVIRSLLADREPELRTLPFRRFWRGAYESIDRVQAWWHARELVFVGHERRGGEGSAARPTKYFFLTPKGEETAARLVAALEHARWYDERIRLIHAYYGTLTAAEIKQMQYSHAPYRDAQINEYIPDLLLDDVEATFERVFGEPLEPIGV